MFLICKFTNKKCGFCGESKGVKYCGLANGENRIDNMKKCPKKKK